MRRVRAILRVFFSRFTLGLRQGLIAVVAAFAAYLPTHFVGLQQGFWSAITAIAVAQMEFRDSTSVARRQCIGAAIGGSVGLALGLAFGDQLQVYAAAIVLSVLLSRLLNVADAGQLAGITSTIILLVPHAGSIQDMLLSRLSEVAWGAAMGILVAWLENQVIRRI